MKEHSQTPPGKQEPDEILEDLEDIKDLLVDDDGPTEDVPLLDETVEEEPVTMSDETFNALLGETWGDSIDDLFNQTRERITDNGENWLPEDTDDLDTALRTRIDQSVKSWLDRVVKENLDSLKQQLVDDLAEEIASKLDDKLTPSSKQTR